jgi:hypothetical protein
MPLLVSNAIKFINDYKITDKTNPIGFWQTVLDNHNFDYSVNFKCKFKIGSNKTNRPKQDSQYQLRSPMYDRWSRT